MYVGVHISRHLKEELPWVTYERLRIISTIMLFKTVIPLRNFKNKAVLSLNNIVCIAKLSLVMYSNCTTD